MIIGHINLEKSFNGTGEHFVSLIEALDRRGIHQHALVSNHSMAKRLSVCQHVTVGPVVQTAVAAYCRMPNVDVCHAHDSKGGRAGLLLTLTRSTPFVMTTRG